MCYGICRYEDRDGECAKPTKIYPPDAPCRDVEDNYEYEPELDRMNEHEERQIEHAERLLDEWKDEGKPATWRGRRMPQRK